MPFLLLKLPYEVLAHIVEFLVSPHVERDLKKEHAVSLLRIGKEVTKKELGDDDAEEESNGEGAYGDNTDSDEKTLSCSAKDEKEAGEERPKKRIKLDDDSIIEVNTVPPDGKIPIAPVWRYTTCRLLCKKMLKIVDNFSQMHIIQQTRVSTKEFLNSLPFSDSLPSCLKDLDGVVCCLRRQIQLPADISEYCFKEDKAIQQEALALTKQVKVLKFKKGEDYFEASYGYGVSSKFQINIPPKDSIELEDQEDDFVTFSVQGIQGWSCKYEAMDFLIQIKSQKKSDTQSKIIMTCSNINGDSNFSWNDEEECEQIVSILNMTDAWSPRVFYKYLLVLAGWTSLLDEIVDQIMQGLSTEMERDSILESDEEDSDDDVSEIGKFKQYVEGVLEPLRDVQQDLVLRCIGKEITSHICQLNVKRTIPSLPEPEDNAHINNEVFSDLVSCVSAISGCAFLNVIGENSRLWTWNSRFLLQPAAKKFSKSYILVEIAGKFGLKPPGDSQSFTVTLQVPSKAIASYLGITVDMPVYIHSHYKYKEKESLLMNVNHLLGARLGNLFGVSGTQIFVFLWIVGMAATVESLFTPSEVFDVPNLTSPFPSGLVDFAVKNFVELFSKNFDDDTFV